MHCGFIPKDTWLGEHPDLIGLSRETAFGGRGYDVDICPGYATRAPAVAEGMRAYFWWNKSQLHLAIQTLSHPLMEAVETVSNAFSEYEREQLEKTRSA